MANEVADVQRLLKASGLTFKMHASGTTVGQYSLSSRAGTVLTDLADKKPIGPEGPWDDVMRVIGQAHALVHSNGVVRIQSSMRVGTR